jgi:metallo-beta-lactamase family protein
MTITPLGAAGGEVTGSAYLVQTESARVLVDFGLFQGGRKADLLNKCPPVLKPRSLDAVVLTHAHLDHTGRLPMLAQAGFRGPIYCTPATAELAAIVLRDSAKLQTQDAERDNRKRERAGQPPRQPLYDADDAEAVIRLFKDVPYNQPVPVAKGITAQYVEAGHMLGSASIQLGIEQGGVSKRVVFSGDVGPRGAPILKDAEPFHEADFVFLESTYGDRDHRAFSLTVEQFYAALREAVAKRGKILVPSFAIGRAQVIVMLLAHAIRQKIIPSIPVYLDSPMAIEASKVFEHHPELFDDEMNQFLDGGSLKDTLDQFKNSTTADESKAINRAQGPAVVIAGAGMCNAGRIVHHLRNNVWKPETTVMIVGYQAEGSLGRLLVDGVKKVKIFGEVIAVKATVQTLNGFSGHAGQTDLLNWLSAMAGTKPRVALVHGEDRARKPLAAKIQERFGIDAQLAALGEAIQL